MTERSVDPGGGPSPLTPEYNWQGMDVKTLDVRVMSKPSKLRRASAGPQFRSAVSSQRVPIKSGGAGRAEEGGVHCSDLLSCSQLASTAYFSCPPPRRRPPPRPGASALARVPVHLPSPRSPPISSARLGEPCPWAGLAPWLEPYGLFPRPPPLQPLSPPPRRQDVYAGRGVAAAAARWSSGPAAAAPFANTGQGPRSLCRSRSRSGSGSRRSCPGW